MQRTDDHYKPKTLLGWCLGLALVFTIGLPVAFMSACDTIVCQDGFIKGFKESLRPFFEMGAEIGDKVMGA
jgi:hypothetical protein